MHRTWLSLGEPKGAASLLRASEYMNILSGIRNCPGGDYDDGCRQKNARFERLLEESQIRSIASVKLLRGVGSRRIKTTARLNPVSLFQEIPGDCYRGWVVLVG